MGVRHTIVVKCTGSKRFTNTGDVWMLDARPCFDSTECSLMHQPEICESQQCGVILWLIKTNFQHDGERMPRRRWN